MYHQYPFRLGAGPPPVPLPGWVPVPASTPSGLDAGPRQYPFRVGCRSPPVPLQGWVSVPASIPSGFGYQSPPVPL